MWIFCQASMFLIHQLLGAGNAGLTSSGSPRGRGVAGRLVLPHPPSAASAILVASSALQEARSLLIGGERAGVVRLGTPPLW